MSGEEQGGSGGLGRLLVVMLVVLGLLLVTGWAVARTQGFTQLLQEKLGAELGMPLTLDRTHIGWPYDLVMTGFRSVATNEGVGRVSFDEVRVGLAGLRKVHVTVRGGRADMAIDAQGAWSPGWLHDLGILDDVRDMPAMMATLYAWISVRVEGVRLQRTPADGRVETVVEGLGFSSEPLDLPGHPGARYYQVKARQVTRRAGPALAGVDREWISTLTNPYVEIGYRTEHGTGVGTGDFWAVPGAGPQETP